jgi:hypothetical protein
MNETLYFLSYCISRHYLEIKPLFNSRESLKNDILSSKSEEVPFPDKRDFFLVLSSFTSCSKLGITKSLLGTHGSKKSLGFHSKHASDAIGLV